MAINFPTSLDALGNPSDSTLMNDGTYNHATQHADANDAIEALQAKVGINSSAVSTSHDYKLARTINQGKHTIWIPAAAMTARATNGAAAGTAETSTNKVMLSSLDFDASTIEYAQFCIQMPESWDESTITAKFTWKHAATTTNFGVSWGIQGVALSDDDASDAAFGTAIYANDTGGTTGDIYRSPETAAVTIAGTPATGDYVVFQVLRKADDGTNDTMAIDAGLLGVSVFYTVAAGTD